MAAITTTLPPSTSPIHTGKRKHHCTTPDIDYNVGIDGYLDEGVAMERTSSGAKRRKTPANNNPSDENGIYGGTVNVSDFTFKNSNAAFGQDAIMALQLHSPMLHHPFPQQIIQTPSLDFNQTVHDGHNHHHHPDHHYHSQLTPPIESSMTHGAAEMEVSQQRAMWREVEEAAERHNDNDGDMIMDEIETDGGNTHPGSRTIPDQPHQQPQQLPWIRLSEEYAAPPTPRTPAFFAETVEEPDLGVYAHEDITAPADIHREVAVGMQDQHESNEVQQNLVYEDPLQEVWAAHTQAGRASHQKNADGRVKGFKMGYLEECVKCRNKEMGHFGHFVMAPR